MNYKDALAASKKVGASRCEGLPLLAMTCLTLSMGHAINPEMVYNGAVKLGHDARAVRKLPLDQMSDLMFV